MGHETIHMVSYKSYRGRVDLQSVEQEALEECACDYFTLVFTENFKLRVHQDLCPLLAPVWAKDFEDNELSDVIKDHYLGVRIKGDMPCEA